MVAFLGHLDGVRHAVERLKRILVRPAFLVRVTMAADGDERHRRNFDEHRLLGRKVELLVFLLVVKCHRNPLSQATLTL